MIQLVYLSKYAIYERPFIYYPGLLLEDAAVKLTAIALSIAMIFFGTVALAESSFLSALKARYNIPNGSKLDTCNTCHSGQWARNVYGADLQTAGAANDINAAFDATDNLDSDDDGALNWAELVNGTWPGDPNDATPVRPSTWGKIKALYN